MAVAAILAAGGIGERARSNETEPPKQFQPLAGRPVIAWALDALTGAGGDDLQKLLPSRQGIVTITLKGGRTLRHHTKAVRGTAQNPMTRAEVDEKCFHLLAPVLGKSRARRLVDSVWDIEKVKDVRALRPLLRA